MSFREAKNKGGQIEILADLNACTEDDIRELLKRHGYTPPEKVKKQFNKKKSAAVPTVVVIAITDRIDKLNAELQELEKQRQMIRQEIYDLNEFMEKNCK